MESKKGQIDLSSYYDFTSDRQNRDEACSVSLLRSHRRKRLSVEIDASNRIRIRAPEWLPMESIDSFIEAKSAWIQRTLEKNREALKTLEDGDGYTQSLQYSVQDGGILPYRGKSYTLSIVPHKRTSVFLLDETIYIQLAYRKDSIPQPSGAPVLLLKRLLVVWYKQMAKQRIEERVAHYSRIMGITYAGVRVKDVRSIWGSSSARGNLNFNYRLIMLDDRLLDYVVVHELAHILRKDHSPVFWRIVQSVLPDWKDRRKQLRSISPKIFFLLSG